MPPDARAYLIDIVEACDAIATATKGIDLAEYDRNRLIRTVDNALVWAVVEHDMPVLRRECARLLEQQSGDRDFG